MMKEQDMDALFLCQREDVEHFSGFWSMEWDTNEQVYAVLLPKEGDPILFVPSFMKGTAEGTSWVKDIRVYVAHAHKKERFAPVVVKAIRESGLASGVVGIESGVGFLLRMPLTYFEAIKSDLPRTKFVNAANLLQEAVMIKSQLEIERIKKACAITCRAYEKTFSSLKVGMSEKEIYRIHGIAMMEEGASKIGFINLRAGIRSMPGSNPSDRKLRKGDIFFCDSGAYYRGYWCDMIRIAHIGEPCPYRDKKLYDTLIKARQAGIELMKPGVKVRDVYSATMDAIRTSGYKFRSLYMIGHGLGLGVHEKPWICLEEKTVLEQGMVLAFEPWMYNPARGTFCIEDDILITDKGNEVLTPFPREEIWAVSC